MKPGLIVNASDGELTVWFLAATPDLAVDLDESVHPQLKPDFRAVWSGFLHVIKTGPHIIYGPSQTTLDGKPCGGQKIILPAGHRALRIEVARKRTEPLHFTLEWESDDFSRQPIPASAFFHDAEPKELREHHSRDFGRELFENLSCAACHQGGPIPYPVGVSVSSPIKGLPITSLQPTQGCLSDNPKPSLPQFRLTSIQREALQLFLQSPDISRAPAVDLARQFRRFHCFDCHAPDFRLQRAQFESGLRNHRDLELIFPPMGVEDSIRDLAHNYARLRLE